MRRKLRTTTQSPQNRCERKRPLGSVQAILAMASCMIVLLSVGLVGCKKPDPHTLIPVSNKQVLPPNTRLKPVSARDLPLLPLPLDPKKKRQQMIAFENMKLLVVAPPTFRKSKTAPIYPCTACHTNAPNKKRRKLKEKHTNIKLKHGRNSMWCYHCHSSQKIDFLHLADGTLIKYEQSYKLCFQCHGDKTRDWLAGIHGSRTGYWRGGPQRYLLCTHCHDPHSPKPMRIKPAPPPIPPHLIKAPGH